ncbi:MAG: ATP-NAD kinase family protein [Sulfolobales archaeon]
MAGLGGEPGLKGSDEIDVLKILSEGYKMSSYDRARRFLEALSRERIQDLRILIPEDPMGCSIVREYKDLFREIECVKLYSRYVNGLSTRDHTIEFVRNHSRDCDLILFVGGDGTARDILQALREAGDLEKPVLGIPAGVKVYSGVFARSPETAARVLSLYIEGSIPLSRRPVVDADENSLRRGFIELKNWGFMMTPYSLELVQDSKSPISYYWDLDYEGVARYLDEIFESDPGSLYIVGPGGSLKRIFEYLSIDKTAYGVDAIYRKKIVGRDLSRRDIERIALEYNRIRVILTPIPGTRFLIGRGNQQISSEIFRRSGREGLIPVVSMSKLGGSNVLYIDSGDEEVDRMLSGYVRALTGYREELLIRLIPARYVA